MPIILKKNNATPAANVAAAPPEETSGFQNVRNMLGMGTRLVGGFLSNAGSWPGALIGGGSELIAQGIEGSLGRTTIPRVAAEAAIGAVPLGNLVKGGRIAASAAKNAAFSGGGDIGRQVAEQYDPSQGRGVMDTDIDWQRAGGATLLGGGVGATLGHLSPSRETLEAAMGRSGGSAPLPEVIDNSGRPLRRANVARTGAGPTNAPATNVGAPGVAQPEIINNQRMPIGGGDIEALPSAGRARTASNRAREVAGAHDEALQEDRLRELKKLFQTGDNPPKATMSETIQGAGDVGQREAVSMKWGMPEDAVTGGQKAISRVGTEIANPEVEEIIQRGMSQPGTPNETFALWLIEGKSIDEAATLARQGVKPASATRVQEIIDESPLRAFDEVAESPVPRVPGGIADDVSPEDLSSRFDDELSSLMDEGEALPAGMRPDPVVTDPVARMLNATVDEPPATKVPGTPRPDAYYGPFDPATGRTDVPVGDGMSWVDEALDDIKWRGGEDTPSRFAAPPRGSKPRAPKAPPTPKFAAQPGASEDEGLQSLLDFLDVDAAYGKAAAGTERKELGSIFGRTQKRAQDLNAPEATAIPKQTPGSETGLGVTEALLHVAGGTLGAGVGAALDDEGSPIEGAAAGLAIGAGAPAIPRLLQSVNLTPDVLRTPEGIKDAARRIIDALPQYQRAAYLSDLRGLPANMWAGPYGSMMTGAIEAGLKGDPRGWEVVKQAWNPFTFIARDWPAATDEAMDYIRRGELGRAEGLQLGGPIKTGLATPGIGMTMGDVAARRHLMMAGFSEDEARRMTLTSEPLKDSLGHALVNFGKTNPLANILFPFRRTPANIMSEGSDRLPGLGIGKKLLSKSDDPINWRDAGVEQGLGLATGTAGYQLGQELDDPRSTAQNVISRTASNLGGRYSLPVSLGALLGRTVGQDKKLNQRDVQRMVDQSIPLPAANSIADAASYVGSKFGLTSNQDPPLPRGMVPLQHLFREEEPRPLSSLRIRR